MIFFRVKYLYQNIQQKWKYHRRKKQGPIGMNHSAFSAAQYVCSKLHNQAKCDAAAFTSVPLIFNFSCTFWLLKLTIIAKRNIIARWRIVPYLMKPSKNNNVVSNFISSNQDKLVHLFVCFARVCFWPFSLPLGVGLWLWLTLDLSINFFPMKFLDNLF